MIENNKSREKNGSNNKILFIISMIAAIPLLIILIIYTNNPDSIFLHYIVNSSANLPGITSAKNPLMSRAMSDYCKTAPLFSLMVFLFSMKKLTIPSIGKTKAIKVSICSSILFLVSNFTFLCINKELTTSVKLLKLASTNDFSLFLFYSSLYISLSMFTLMALTSYYLVFYIFKGRK